MSAKFDGVDDVINVGSPSVLDGVFAGGASFSCWIKPASHGENKLGRIFDKVSGSTGVLFTIDDSDVSQTITFKQWFSAKAGHWYYPTGTVSTFNQWMYLTVTYNSNSVSNLPKFYLDGVLQTTEVKDAPEGTASNANSEDMRFGNNSAGSETFDGELADLRFYDRIISAGEIETIYASNGHDFITDGLIGWWTVNEGSEGSTMSGSNSVKDLSSEGNHGTPSNSPSYQGDFLTFRRL